MLLLALTYGLRGVAYPMFAYAFLVWIQSAAPAEMRGSATGWFWLAFTGGLPTLGSLVAIFSIRRWANTPPSGCRWSGGDRSAGDAAGAERAQRLSSLLDAEHRQQGTLRTLMGGIDILWREPRIAAAAVVRIINTTPYFGFFIFLPGFSPNRLAFPRPNTSA